MITHTWVLKWIEIAIGGLNDEVYHNLLLLLLSFYNAL